MDGELEEFKPEKGYKAASIASDIMESHRFVTDDAGTVYRYEAGLWRRLPDVQLARLAMDGDKSGGSTGHRRREIVDFIKTASYDPDLTWGRVADHEIPCANGIVDVLTGAVRPHEPEHYLERVIPHTYDPAAKADTWHQAITDWFGDGEGDGSIEALQEFFGYACLSHAHFKKALMIYGPADCGKSQVVYALQGLVGTRYTCQLSVEHMDDPTRRAIIKGKALNIMTELPTNALIADAGFKTLVSTEEPILLDEKYRPAEMYTPTAKHVIATNHLPRVNDRTEATFNRLLLLPMLKSIATEDQDKALKRKLKGEMAGILAFAVEGARRLVERDGEWREPLGAGQLMKDYRDENNPVRQFLRERCAKDDKAAIPLQVFARQFNSWNTGGRKAAARGVSAMLRSAGLAEAIKDVRWESRILKSLTGWRLLEDVDEPLILNLDEGDADVVE